MVVVLELEKFFSVEVVSNHVEISGHSLSLKLWVPREPQNHRSYTLDLNAVSTHRLWGSVQNIGTASLQSL